MAVLRPEDHNRLHRILKKHPLIASGDPEDRRSMLSQCGAASLCDRLKLGAPSGRFVPALVTNLEGDGPVGNPGLQVFLKNYLVVYPEEITAGERAFISAIAGSNGAEGGVDHGDSGGTGDMSGNDKPRRVPDAGNPAGRGPDGTRKDAPSATVGEPGAPMDARPSGQTGNTWNPLKLAREFLREAVEAVPAVKYALAVGGVASVVAIVIGRFGLGLDPRVAVIGAVVMIILMVVMLIFARGTDAAGETFRWPILVLTWSVLVLFIATSGCLFTSVFFKWPLNLNHWLM